MIYTKFFFENVIRPRFEKLERKARKYNVPIQLIVKQEFLDYLNPEDLYKVEMVEVEITGNVIKIGDWHVIARIDHLGKNAIINAYEEIPKEYRKRGGVCDHCGINRRRVVTYLLRNGVGEIKQVGKSCLGVFLGIDPSKIFIWEKIREMFEDPEPEHWWNDGCRPKAWIEVKELIALAAAIIRKYGYLSKTEAEKLEYKIDKRLCTTGERVLNQLTNPHLTKEEQVEILPEDRELAKSALDWIKIQKPTNDYLHNLITLTRQEYIEKKHVNYLISLIPAYHKAMEKEKDRQKYTDQFIREYIGKKGERIQVDVEIIKVRKWETEWGITYLYVMKDEQNHCIVWKTNRFLDKDKRWIIKGTVKNHDIYEEVYQTVITRGTVIERKTEN